MDGTILGSGPDGRTSPASRLAGLLDRRLSDGSFAGALADHDGARVFRLVVMVDGQRRCQHAVLDFCVVDSSRPHRTGWTEVTLVREPDARQRDIRWLRQAGHDAAEEFVDGADLG